MALAAECLSNEAVLTAGMEEQGKKYSAKGSDYGVVDQVAPYRQWGQEDWPKG